MNTNTTTFDQKNNFLKATIEWFNITPARLFLLSLITGGIYLFYWFYRQLKAIIAYRMKNHSTLGKIISLLGFVVFYFFPVCSIGVLWNINDCLMIDKIRNKKKMSVKLYPLLTCLLFGALYSSTLRTIITFNILPFLSNTENKLVSSWQFGMVSYLFWFLCIFIGTLIVVRYQKAIQDYCIEKEIPLSKVSFLEIIWLILGLCLAFIPFHDLSLCLAAVKDIDLFKLTFLYEKLSSAIN